MTEAEIVRILDSCDDNPSDSLSVLTRLLAEEAMDRKKERNRIKEAKEQRTKRVKLWGPLVLLAIGGGGGTTYNMWEGEDPDPTPSGWMDYRDENLERLGRSANKSDRRDDDQDKRIDSLSGEIQELKDSIAAGMIWISDHFSSGKAKRLDVPMFIDEYDRNRQEEFESNPGPDPGASDPRPAEHRRRR